MAMNGVVELHREAIMHQARAQAQAPQGRRTDLVAGALGIAHEFGTSLSSATAVWKLSLHSSSVFPEGADSAACSSRSRFSTLSRLKCSTRAIAMPSPVPTLCSRKSL